MFERKDLHYRLLNGQGDRVGMPIEASSIYSSPTLSNLEKLFQPSQTAQKPYGERLKYLLDKTLATAETEDSFIRQLQEKEVKILSAKMRKGILWCHLY